MADVVVGGGQTSTSLSIFPSKSVDPNPDPGPDNGSGVRGGSSGSSSTNSESQSSATPTSPINTPPPDASTTGSFTALPSPTVIVFDDAANFGPRPDGRIFSSDTQIKVFSWKIGNSTTTPLNIFWYGKPNASEEAFDVFQARPIARAEFGDSGPGNEIVNLSSSNATLNLTGSALTSGNWYNKDMVIKIDWRTKNGKLGFSQSGVFTVSNGTPLNEQAFEQETTNNDQDRRGGETVTSSIDNPAVPTSGPPTGSGGDGSGDGSGGSSRGGGGGGGLSTGAIAGIAVSCSIVGIILIGGLAWILLRRRRRRHFDQGYNATGQTTRSFIATKEVQPSVAESPIVSPFSDDGDRARSGSNNAMLPLQAAAAGTTAAGLASTHEDEVGRPSTATSGNNNTSRNIAHLVEDGMTEADILRLEEEERHLDAEIERVTRRTSS